MAFSVSEIQRIKYELGHHTLSAGVLPYIGHSALFEGVVNSNVPDAVETTATQTVAAKAGSTPLTFADAAGFVVGSRVIVDIGASAETTYIQSLAGNVARVSLKKAHSGTYPVMLDGTIAIARIALYRIELVREQMEGVSGGEGSIKKADELEFYQGSNNAFGSLKTQMDTWRDELAGCLGVENFWRKRNAGSQRLTLY